MPAHRHLFWAGAVLLPAVLLAVACGQEPSSDLGQQPVAPTITSGAPAPSTAGRTGASPTPNRAGASVDVTRVNAVCQQALDYYHRNRDVNDPVQSQVVANEAISGAVGGLEAMRASGLTALTAVLREYAAIGGQLAAAMDDGDTVTAGELFDRSEAIGVRVRAAATTVGAATCAKLGGL